MNAAPISLTSVLVSGILLAGLSAAASAQEGAPRHAGVESFSIQHGAVWRVVTDPASGNPTFVYGGRIAAPPGPRVDFETVARQVVDANFELFGITSGCLELDQVKVLELSRVGSSDKVAVVFRQSVDSMPVLDGTVTVLFDRASGDVLAIDSTGVPFAHEVDLYPASSTGEALTVAHAEYAARFGVAATQIDLVDVAIVGPGARFGPESPLAARGAILAYVFELSSPGSLTADGVPVQGRVIVSAAGDLAVLRSEATAHATVSGTVKGNVNTGPEPNKTNNQEQPTLANLDVRNNSTTGPVIATTDVAGNYSINQTGPLNLYFMLQGPYVKVVNKSAGNTKLALTGATGAGNDVLFNSTMMELPTAEVAAFYWVNRFHEWVVGVDPTDTTMDFPVVAHVNSMLMPCNAYFSGTEIVFSRAGYGCPNMAFSGVILHEEGHWATMNYCGNASNAFHEGNADSFAYFITDDPCMDDFSGGCIRNALQTSVLKCPKDGDESCHGGDPHVEGQALASALWAVRSRLNSTYGNGPGDAVADVLFSAWQNVYNDGKILNVIQDHWLALDDDNGNLADLTPNYPEITGGFAAYNWPSYPLPTGYFSQYGTGCPGTGGIVPALAGTGTPGPSANISVDVSHGRPGAVGVLLLGLGKASIALSGGCTLLVGSVIGGGVPIVLDGSGALVLPAKLPAFVWPAQVYLQCFVADAGAANGLYSATNGLMLRLL